MRAARNGDQGAEPGISQRGPRSCPIAQMTRSGAQFTFRNHGFKYSLMVAVLAVLIAILVTATTPAVAAPVSADFPMQTGRVGATMPEVTGRSLDPPISAIPDESAQRERPSTVTDHRVTRGHGRGRPYVPLGVIGLLSWSVWAIRRYLSRYRYNPLQNRFCTTTSVVVPVYREDPDVLERCLHSWVRQSPTEVILVVDDGDEELLARLEDVSSVNVRVLKWHHTGKRGALGAGIRASIGDIVVLVDSDTEWRVGLLAAIQMPFIDPRVGGVGSRQHVYLPTSNLWRRVAYWMINCRYLDYVPAMSRRGSVACLSGRTAAYRRSVILPLLPALEHEVFVGRECVAGDDGRLTWLVLAAGYRTVHQATAQADSMFPSELTAFVRQRVRWSRNSYRCYLTALAQGWLWRQPLITQVTVLQILLTPLSMGAAVWFSIRWVERGGWTAAAVVLLWATVSRALRATSHLIENPKDVAIAPIVALTVALIALPIKLYAALTMNHHGWLTRWDGDRVQGQSEIEVASHASVG